ncbi:MAG: hypothetical protein QNK04_02060 [Myxococcota bacterium]|nr:hypothetical protein [Myxococcota bacterium]
MQEEPASSGNVVPLRKSRASRLWAELARHPYAYAVVVVFGLAGAVLAPMLIPEASPWMGAAGGLAMGVYAALCAVPNKFLG